MTGAAPVHIMLDIETLGTRVGSVVLSAAFVRFSDFQSTGCNLSIGEQQVIGLEIDPQTELWWREQSAEAWRGATENPVQLVPALQHFAAWLAWARGDASTLYIWCHGASFDAPLLAEVYRLAGVPLPWGYRDIRDTRTLYDLAGVDPRDFSYGTLHNARDDAIAQTQAAVEALRRLAGRS